MKERVGGRTLKFKTPQELANVINKYIDATPTEELTITGLALVVGSKQLLGDYEKRKDYEDIVRRAKLIIEHSYELSLRKKGNAGDIFGLKNFGWIDKTEIDHGLSDSFLEKFNNLSKEELLKKANELITRKPK